MQNVTNSLICKATLREKHTQSGLQIKDWQVPILSSCPFYCEVNMENNYIYRLKINMFEQGFSTSYIDKCCSYATLLISQSLPVIFDKNHLDQILMLP